MNKLTPEERLAIELAIETFKDKICGNKLDYVIELNETVRTIILAGIELQQKSIKTLENLLKKG